MSAHVHEWETLYLVHYQDGSSRRIERCDALGCQSVRISWDEPGGWACPLRVMAHADGSVERTGPDAKPAPGLGRWGAQ